jgi:hypothetical protein
MLPSGIERHKDWRNELYKKISKEVKQAFPLDVFLRTLFLCKFGVVAYEVNNYVILVRWQKRLQKALEVRIFYIIAVITTK